MTARYASIGLVNCIICGQPAYCRSNFHASSVPLCRKPACKRARKTALQKARRSQLQLPLADVKSVKKAKKPVHRRKTRRAK